MNGRRLLLFSLLGAACGSENKGPEDSGIVWTDPDIADGSDTAEPNPGEDSGSPDADDTGELDGEDPPIDSGEVDTANLDTGSPDTEDGDGDGFSAAEDCDDSDPLVNPSADERCDGIDNNCDDIVDLDAIDMGTFYEDWDGDGFGDEHLPVSTCFATDLYVEDASDCDDTDPFSYLGAPEYAWDSIDQDCDGATEYESDCIEAGVAAAMTLLDGDYPLSSATIGGLLLTDLELVLGIGEISLLPITVGHAYQARVPLSVGLNTEASPFRIDGSCDGWIASEDQEIVVDLDLSLDGLWALTVDVEVESAWVTPGDDTAHDDCTGATSVDASLLLAHVSSAYSEAISGIGGGLIEMVEGECGAP